MVFDVTIILSYNVRDIGHLTDEARARIEKGADMFSRNGTKKIITTGFYNVKQKRTGADAAAEYLRKQGIPGAAIRTSTRGLDTVGEILFTKIDIVKEERMKDIAIVSSRYHLPRVRAIVARIYGPDRTVTVMGAEEGPWDFEQERKVRERLSLKKFRETFKGVRRGDDQGLLDRLTMAHPLYKSIPIQQ